MIKNRHRLPSGFGTIRKLGGKRTKPYAIHPPAVKETVKGRIVWKRPAAICYASSWDAGLKILSVYHAGMYKDGIEDLIEENEQISVPETKNLLYDYCRRVLSDIENIKNGILLRMEDSSIETGVGKEKGVNSAPSFAEVYKTFYEYKFGAHAQKKLSKSTRTSMNAAYKRYAPYYELTLDEISVDDLQELVNETADEGFSKSTVSRIVTLAHQLWRYAYPRGLCTKESGKYVEMPAVKDEEHHQDFTEGELAKLWEHYINTSDSVIQMILVMCYSGFRVNEYVAENFVTMDDYFQGGFKTAAGKDRIVPIHSVILPLVHSMKEFFSGKSTDAFREEMKSKLIEIGIDGIEVDGIRRYHTPHSCRHTFSRLCESYGVNEADRKRMMGHSLSNDVTNGVYGHRTVAELSKQIEKIQIPGIATAA